MAVLKASRNVQFPLHQEFTFNIASGDTMVNTSSASQTFAAAAGVFDVINLPAGAVVVGGEMVVETVSNDTGTATISVGDSSSATRYLAATNIKAAARTALTLTGYRSDGASIRITLANQNGNATTGKVTVRVQYVIPGRAHEVQPN